MNILHYYIMAISAASYNNIDKTIDEFVKYLNNDKEFIKMTDKIVIFKCGTVILLERPGIAEEPIEKVLEFFEQDFPSHRVKNCDTFFVDVRKNIELFKNFETPIKQLILSGYPLPGGPMADSSFTPLTDHLCMTFFPYCDPSIVNITYDEELDMQTLMMMGRDLRRYDWMVPCPYAVLEKVNDEYIKLEIAF